MKITESTAKGGICPVDAATKAFIYRKIASGNTAGLQKTYEGLGGIPTGSDALGNGDLLLPVRMSSKFITDPLDENALRSIEHVTQIHGLEEPKLMFLFDEEDLEDVSDLESARELQANAEKIVYGRFKTKIFVNISDTILHGTDEGIAKYVEDALSGSLARKEKLRAFATSADADHAHMSFYQSGIRAVTGATILDAVIAAWSELPDMFSSKAVAVMRKTDYYSAIRSLSNSSVTLFGKTPEEVIGIPVVFSDKAIVPVVGDFSQAGLNYDSGVMMDYDKDGRKGNHYYILTAWFDHQIKVKSAFRLAITCVKVIGAVVTGSTKSLLAGEDLRCSPVFNTADTPDSGTSFEWETLNEDTWETASDRTGYNTDTVTTVDEQDEGVSFRCKVTYSDGTNSSTVYSRKVTMS